MILSKKIIVIFCLSAFVTIAAQTAPLQDDRPKNLKVLPKDISSKDLDKLMDQYCNALGVSCDFCHYRNMATKDLEFEKDTKPEKEITRNMMRMNYAINKTYFNFTKTFDPHENMIAVSCMTCHRKQPRPELDSTFIKAAEKKWDFKN